MTKNHPGDQSRRPTGRNTIASNASGRPIAYYLCPTKGCESYRKSIKREELESSFEGLLERLEPSENLFKLAKAMFKDAWNMRLAQAKHATKHLKANVIEIEKKIETALDRMVETDSSAVISELDARMLMNHSVPGVNSGYITRHKLLEDHLRAQQQAISNTIFAALGDALTTQPDLRDWLGRGASRRQVARAREAFEQREVKVPRIRRAA